jgi:Family of unknown function (DUF5678)
MTMQTNTNPTESLPPSSAAGGLLYTDADAVSVDAGIISLHQELAGRGAGADVDKVVKRLGLDAERLERRNQLLLPASEDHFTAAIKWIIQLGVEDDLEVIRRAKSDLPYDTEDVRMLLKMAQEKLEEQANEPGYVARKGEEAYRLHRREWEEAYGGQYVAVRGGRVVAHAADKDELLKEIVKIEKAEGPFRAYVVLVGAEEPPAATGPRVRLGLRERPTEGP